MREKIFNSSCLLLLTFSAFCLELQSEKQNFHDIDLNIKISCPDSEEFTQFLNSGPLQGERTSTLQEWQSSFVYNINHLIKLVESGKMSNAMWSLKIDKETPKKDPEEDRPYYAIAHSYIDCCCFSLSFKQFESLLDENVNLFHQTNEESPFVAKGKKTISELFQKYIGDNSSNIKLIEYAVKYENETIHIKLVVEEDKNGPTDFGRFHFEEVTQLQINKTNPCKITSIHSIVKKVPV